MQGIVDATLDSQGTDQPPQPAPDSIPRQTPDQAPGGTTSPNSKLNLAELKVLQWFQSEIHRRTGELELERQRRGTWSAEQQTELQELANDQNQLLTIVQELIDDSTP